MGIGSTAATLPSSRDTLRQNDETASPSQWYGTVIPHAVSALLALKPLRCQTRLPGWSALDCEEPPGAGNAFEFALSPVLKHDA